MRILVLVAIYSFFAPLGSLATDRPNILWLTCEDMGPHLGCYGDSYSVSPNIDALATRSLRYTNANSNAPVCAPARTTIISGLYPPSTGAEHMRSSTRMPKRFKMFPQFLRSAGYYCTNNSKEDYNLEKPGHVWDESSRRAHWKNRAKGQPFFAIFNDTTTHESQIRNEINPADRKHDPAKVKVPIYHPDTPGVRTDWAQYYDRITMMDREVGAKLKELNDAGLADDTIVFFLSDHGSGMPRNKRSACNSGLNMPMIVYFPPKWRHLAPKDYSQSGTSDRLVSFIDLAPTILSLADIRAPDWMQGGAFAGKNQQPEPEYSYGFRGRMDERYDTVRSVRDKRYMYVRNYMPHRPHGQHNAYMFATPTTQAWFRLHEQGRLSPEQDEFWRAKQPEVLYDLQSDPGEVYNLAKSPSHQDVLVRMREAHKAWEHRIKDVGLLSEWEMHDRSRDSTPYEMGHDPKQYDFDAVFKAATRATTLDPSDLPQLVKLLASKDSGVRYWAAIGLLAQGKAGLEAGHDELVAALDDDSPAVRIPAAEAVAGYGNAADTARALKVLLTYVQPDADLYLAMAAWNALDNLNERALPVLQALKNAKPKPKESGERAGGNPAILRKATLAGLQGEAPKQ